ncbi:hypothetical protein D9758_012560 [Tetrapyrgos nigripes]|uniref:RING-type domain-containing protein n=1 Tax=Tetrapyrgos nigripes TaxID=182062 RepID=A0A8H5CGP2_9AGAR|nr:hypothetical protein D9758_012560 [Tetrapyrgos nigripes]
MRKLVRRAEKTKGLDFREFDEFAQLLGRLVAVKERRSKLPLVRYLPCIPDLQPSEVNGPASSEWLSMFVHSDIPSVCIEDYNACCNICLEDFEEPALAPEFQVDDGMDDVEPEDDRTPKPLRKLICGHVLHEECLPMFQNNNYDKMFECPACRTQVWTSPHDPEQFSLLSDEFPRDANYYDTLPPWERIHQQLSDWAILLSTSQLDADLDSTTHGHQVSNRALHIWTSQTYGRYIHSKMTDSTRGVVDCLFVEWRMARMINTSLFKGDHSDAGSMLRMLSDALSLKGVPRLLVVLDKHFADQCHWVVHKFSLLDGALTTYHFFPKDRAFQASHPTELWWSAFRLAWPHAAIYSRFRNRIIPKVVRVLIQLTIDESVAVAGVYHNILMGLPAEDNVDIKRLRDVIGTEVKSLCQRCNSWASYLSTLFSDLYEIDERVERDR